MQHPNGKYGLNHERERKLTEQYYFVQRLRNKDNRFASDPAYIFAAAAYLEKNSCKAISMFHSKGENKLLLFYYLGGLASVKVNPELSQNKRHRQRNEQMIKGNIKKKHLILLFVGRAGV